MNFLIRYFQSTLCIVFETSTFCTGFVRFSFARYYTFWHLLMEPLNKGFKIEMWYLSNHLLASSNGRPSSKTHGPTRWQHATQTSSLNKYIFRKLVWNFIRLFNNLMYWSELTSEDDFLTFLKKFFKMARSVLILKTRLSTIPVFLMEAKS